MNVKALLIIVAILAVMAVPLLLQVGSKEPDNPFPENRAAAEWQARLCGGTQEAQADALAAAQAAVQTKDPDATYALGYVYLTGICLPRDEEQAIILLNKAAAYGSHEAKQILDQRETEQIRLFPPLDGLPL